MAIAMATARPRLANSAAPASDHTTAAASECDHGM
jgi:hypothetical protein